ncbi:hypothetical protein J7J95_01520 [bacterium]|nr:hypothetical protein [bacterium]
MIKIVKRVKTKHLLLGLLLASLSLNFLLIIHRISRQREKPQLPPYESELIEKQRCQDVQYHFDILSEETKKHTEIMRKLKEKCQDPLQDEVVDLNNDGNMEILILTSNAGCVSCHYRWAYIYYNGELRLIKSGHELEIVSEPERNGFYVIEGILSDNEPWCCPSKALKIFYQWDNSRPIPEFLPVEAAIEPYSN